MMRMLVIAVALVALVACARGEHREAREKYNQGIAQLAAQNAEAAEKLLLEARSSAGVDPDLRFRAAYNLGISYDAHAQKLKTGKDADLAKALELQQQAVTWFSDAVRLRKEDRNAQDNLAIVRRRAQALADELSRGEGKLEKRLDAAIGEQRAVLEDARRTWLEVKSRGGADPLAEQSTLTRLADRERGIVADVGVISDLADNEIDGIGKKPEDKRTTEERVRVVQLKNLGQYLEDSRAKIAEARRKFQDLAAEDGVTRSEASLIALKRAREQLLDPIAVLQGIAREEVDLLEETTGVARATAEKTKLASDSTPEPTQSIPAWMEPGPLGERQGSLRDRVEEVRARLQAAVDSAEKPTGSGPDAEPPKLTPEQANMIAGMRLAMPLVVEASAAMDRARSALTDRSLDAAIRLERDALIALAKAIEHFADLKKTIELAVATQQQLVSLLSPQAAAVPSRERAAQTKDGLAQNIARMGRIKDLLSDELTKLNAQRAELESHSAPSTGSSPGSGTAAQDPKQLEEQRQSLDHRKQQMTAAEVYRGDAEKALGELSKAIAANKDPLTPAKSAAGSLEQLRKIFFSVIEHLQDLVRQQNETRDQTSQASGQDDFTRGPKLPALVQRQDEHSQMASAIIDALANQADAKADAAPDPQAQTKAFAAAAAEVRLARTDMTDAKTTLGKAADPQKTQSISLQPAIDSETKAVEHLENALRLLQPPSQNDKQNDPTGNKEQNQQQNQQAQKPDDPSESPKDDQPQPQGGAGQRARDQDAKRQRDRQKPSGGPVDQDW